MKDIKYQEQTRQSTFAQNAITLPDESTKILAAAKEQVQKMESNRQDRVAYANQFIATLKSNAWEERQNRAANYSLEKRFAKDYAKAIEVRRKGDIEREKIKGQEQVNMLKNLTNFSTIALKAVQAVDQKMGEEAEAMGNYLAAIGDLSPGDPVFWDRANRHSEAGQTALHNLANNLRVNGVDDQTINSIINMSGRQLKSAQEYAWSTAGNQYNLTLQEYASKPIQIDGIGKTTLQELLQGKGTVEQIKQAHAQILALQFKNFSKNQGTKGMNPKFISKHFLPGVRKAEAKQLGEYLTNQQNAHLIKAKEERRTETIGTLISNGGFDDSMVGQRFSELLMTRAGGDTLYLPQVKLEAFADVLDGVKSGEIPLWDLYKLGNSTITIPGQGKKLFKDHFKYDWNTLVKEGVRRTEAEEAQSNLAFEGFDQQIKQSVLRTKQTLKRSLNHEEIAATKRAYVDKGYEIPSWLETEGIAEVLNDNMGEELLQSKVNNYTLTRSELYSGKYSSDLITKFENKTIDGASAANKDIVDGQRQGVRAAIAKVGGQLAINPSHRNYEVTALTGIALADLEKRVQAAMKFGDYTHVDKAYTGEGHKLVQEIERGDGIYSLRKQEDGKTIDLKGGFEYFSSSENFSIDRKTKDMIKSARNDSEIIHKKEFYPQDLITETDNIIRNRQVPSWAIQVAKNYKQLNAYDIINRGRDLHGLKPIAAPGYPNAHPMYLTLLEHKSSMWKTTQAMNYTNALHDPTANHFSNALQWMRTSASAFGGADTVTVGSIGSSQVTTGTQAFGQNVEEMTVGNVLELMAQGRLTTVGSYGSNSKQINNLIQSRQININDIFNQETQDKLGVQLIYETVGNFQTNAGDLIEGVGQANALAMGTDGVFDEIERLGGIRAIYADLQNIVGDIGINVELLTPTMALRLRNLQLQQEAAVTDG